MEGCGSHNVNDYRARVTQNAKLTERIFWMTFEAPELARSVRAGQCLMVFTPDGAKRLGRPFEAADADNNNYNIAVATAGTYNIEFDAYAKIITIVPADMQHTVYIKGSFVEGWKITDENGELIDDYKLEETSDGVFEITMTITDEMVDGAT